LKKLLAFLLLVLSPSLHALVHIPPFVFERNTPGEPIIKAVLSIWYSYDTSKVQVKFETEFFVVPGHPGYDQSFLFNYPTCIFETELGGDLTKVECSEVKGVAESKLVVLKNKNGLFTATYSSYDSGSLKNQTILDDKLEIKKKPAFIGMWELVDQPQSAKIPVQSKIQIVEDLYKHDFTLQHSRMVSGRWQSFTLAKELKCGSALTLSPTRQAFESIECVAMVSSSKTVLSENL
jgi:hypothetical protein